MYDIKTDDNSLDFVNGDYVLTSGQDMLLQHIKIALKTLIGDWVLDYTKGIDYVNGLKAYPEILKSQILNSLKEIEGVDQVQNFSFTLDRNTMQYKISAIIINNNNEINLDEVFN